MLHVQLCSCFGVLCERLLPVTLTLHRSAEGPAAIGSLEEGSVETGGGKKDQAATEVEQTAQQSLEVDSSDWRYRGRPISD